MNHIASFLSRASIPFITVAAEEIPETIEVEGKQRNTRNSDGKLIHPTLKGIENFWRWFGESKTVDTQGRPVTFYHSTASDFNVFVRRRGEAGVHFGTLDQADERYKQRPENTGGNISVMPVYLRILNPTRMKDIGTWDKARFGYEAYHKGINPDQDLPVAKVVKALKGKGFDAVVYKNEAEVPGSHDLYEKQKELEATALDAIKSKFGIRSEEYQMGKKRYWFALQDRLSSMPEIQAMRKVSDELKAIRLKGTDSYMVFDANQIKSAIGNNGNFDKTKNEVTASSIAEEEIPDMLAVDGVDRPTWNSKNERIHHTIKGIENFWKWFGDSKAVTDTGRPLVVYHGGDFGISSFDTSLGGDCLVGAGSYFTDNEKEAHGYAHGHIDGKAPAKTPHVYAAYLKLDHPADLRPDTWETSVDVQEYLENNDKAGLNSALRAQHDGAIYDGDLSPVRILGTHFVVFSPEQIKSVRNSGSFDPNVREVTASALTFNEPRVKLDFDKLYGKAFKITDAEGDPARDGFSLITPFANRGVWHVWKERPQFKSIAKKNFNNPDWLGDHKYLQVVDAAKRLGLI